MGVVLVVVVVVLNVFVVSCDDIRTTRVNIGQETKTKESEGNQKRKKKSRWSRTYGCRCVIKKAGRHPKKPGPRITLTTIFDLLSPITPRRLRSHSELESGPSEENPQFQGFGPHQACSRPKVSHHTRGSCHSVM